MNKFEKQNIDICESFKDNLKIIRYLNAHSSSLKEIIENMGNEDVETKIKLLKANRDIVIEINNLIHQTELLVEKYDRFVDLVF